MLLFSCKKEIRVPEHLLSRSELADILIDIHLLEAKLAQIRVPPDSVTMLYDAYEKEIMEKHEVSKQLYTESFMWHFENLNSMETIYGEVIDSLMVRNQTKNITR